MGRYLKSEQPSASPVGGRLKYFKIMAVGPHLSPRIDVQVPVTNITAMTT
jgi:hypothetical protein